MARVVGIDHIVLRASDFEVSRRFYDRLLTFLGFVEEWDLGRTVGWNNGVTMVWVVEAEPGAQPHRTGDIGFHHYAFELVHLLHRALRLPLRELARQFGQHLVGPVAEARAGGGGEGEQTVGKALKRQGLALDHADLFQAAEG